MPQTPPRNIGPYEIIGPLGSGGMGQVYRARDSRLNRDVALKMLPPEYSSDPVRKQRFEQEARAVAALNHPGILSIYDVGDGWMVTELVEGETLRKAHLNIAQAIDVGAQIAEALAAAHDTGITHRDLKPENILLTPEGRTKILDFGLAQVVKPPEPGQEQEVRTVTNPGIPMGTPGYMAPEQVRGQAVDHRADIFSLGVVLYELLSGKPAFEGPSSLEVMHAIVAEEPAELPENVPDGLRRIVKRCLEKRPAQRFQAARDLAFSLRSFGALTTGAAAKVVVAAPPRRSLLWPVAGALIAIAVAAAVAVFLIRTPSSTDISNYHFTPFAYTEDQEYAGVWSPDGQSVAFIRQMGEGPRRLMVQSLDATNPTEIAQPANQPAWAPDGSRIYFLGRGGVMAVSPAGGQPEQILPNATAFHISPDGKSLAVLRATQTQEEGRQYSVWISSPPGAQPVEFSPAPFAVRTPFTAGFLKFSRDGKLLYLSMNTDNGAETWLLPFPAGSGQPRRIFQNVPWNRPVAGSWMPDNRRMVLAGNPAPQASEQLWLADIQSETLTRLMAWPEGGQTTPSVSPDGKRLLFAHVERDRDIVELPLDGSPPITLLATSLPEFSPAWSPVDEQFAYLTRRNGTDELWVRSAEGNWDRPVVTAKEFPTLEALISPVFSPDGTRIAYTALLTGAERRRSLAISPVGGGTPTIIADGYAPSWSPDRASIAFLWLKPDGSLRVATVRVGSKQAPVELIHGPAGPPVWSPSGDWIACSTFRGVDLISPDGQTMRTLPSLGGAQAPLAWSKDGKTLYGLAYTGAEPPTLSALDVRTETVTKIAEYTVGFQPLLENTYTGSIRLSLSPDGKSLAVGTATNKADLWILDGFAR
jgi:Tol biopolymer transport system component/predicted Ser/Thr protein kinase